MCKSRQTRRALQAEAGSAWYEGRVKEGGILLSVHCATSELVSRAKDILKQTGADDIAATGEAGVGSGAPKEHVIA